MSFRVTAIYYIGEGWDVKDEQLYRAAGRKSDASGSEPDNKDKKRRIRDLVWFVQEIEDAKAMRQRLMAAGTGAIVTFREA
jgi:hypothetical protein